MRAVQRILLIGCLEGCASVLLQEPGPALKVPERLREAVPALDRDSDGIPDSLEQELAERFAPIVFYVADEPNLPTNVSRFLKQTSLWYYDRDCHARAVKVADSVAPVVPRLVVKPCSASASAIDSYGTRSTGKERSFFLDNVTPDQQRGSSDSREWTTYYHAYPNSAGGITIQYWRFYAYNTGELLGHRVWVGCHGGDWEALHIVLGPPPGYTPQQLLLLSHKDLIQKAFSAATVWGTHILVLADKGGHTTLLLSPNATHEPMIRHESWTGGTVRWPDGKTTPGSTLVNLGEKTLPMPGMEFLRYSGLWGTRESTGWFATPRSGYWGPAFNETGMGTGNFITAWCSGMADINRSVPDPSGLGRLRECYPSAISP